LLIEHDEDDVFFFRRVLQKLCYNCDLRVCESWADAEEILKQVTPDLIISDYQFSGRTALDSVRALRKAEAYALVPLVIWSGIASRVDQAAFDGLNVSSFVGKCADLSESMAELRPILPV
jgi:CheY-like chemotaxis protein